MKRSFHSANQSVEDFEKEAKYRVADSDEGRDFVNHENSDSNKSLDLESLMLVSPLPNRQRNGRAFNQQQQQSTRFECEDEEACSTVLEASAEEFCLASPSASSLDLTDPFTESIALETTPLQKITRLMQLMAQEERRKDERHNSSFAERDEIGSNTNDEQAGDCVSATATSTASSTTTTLPSPSPFKRRKCDWLELLRNIAPFNDKSGYERIKEIGDGTFSRVISARKKGSWDCDRHCFRRSRTRYR